MRGRSIVAALTISDLPVAVWAVTGDEATHEADHALDADIIELPEVHVHGLPLNKDQQVGPVPKSTPWPAIPSSLDGKPLDDWMKARLLGTSYQPEVRWPGRGSGTGRKALDTGVKS
ncbi:MAG: hypothetical protein H8K10_16155 [Nitrospira sp.]|nr:hypothetical protein [Nitrospira sp.]